ncbi:MAG TPA: tRNA pseudouridine(55) synthase TruB [Verrucomicrobiota bacterium]|nr:tRNA pseudouridine(55) synthase TruB [Verrucomicrobiota bacterium]
MIPAPDALDGGLLVDKPAGLTSHDVVDRLRRHLGIRKVGHAGTLDPAATGLLVLLLGRATKLSDQVMGADKVYAGAFRLGETTNSHDADGEVTARAEIPPDLPLERRTALAAGFLGAKLQTPPMVSAVKVKGVPLYKLARRGQEIEREPRLVHVYSFKFTRYEPPLADFRLACTKGTYVRSIAHDLGQRLGCGAHLFSLRRLASGPLRVEDATPLDSLLGDTPEALAARIIPPARLVET